MLCDEVAELAFTAHELLLGRKKQGRKKKEGSERATRSDKSYRCKLYVAKNEIDEESEKKAIETVSITQK